MYFFQRMNNKPKDYIPNLDCTLFRNLSHALQKQPWLCIFFFLVPFMVFWPFLDDWFQLIDDSAILQLLVHHSFCNLVLSVKGQAMAYSSDSD